MAQPIKLLLPIPASHTEGPIQVLAILLAIQLPSNMLGKAADDGPVIEFLPPMQET